MFGAKPEKFRIDRVGQIVFVSCGTAVPAMRQRVELRRQQPLEDEELPVPTAKRFQILEGRYQPRENGCIARVVPRAVLRCSSAVVGKASSRARKMEARCDPQTRVSPTRRHAEASLRNINPPTSASEIHMSRAASFSVMSVVSQ